MKSLDRRYLKTEKTILDSFVTLLNQKRLEDIQIEDICLEADINKSTFYLHYQSLYYLLSALEDSLVSSLEKALYEKENSTLEEFVSFLVLFARENKKIFSALFKSNDYRFNEKIRTVFFPFLSSKGSKRTITQDNLLAFGLIDGVLSLFRTFTLTNNSKMTKEDFASFVVGFIRSLPLKKAFD